MNTLTTLQQLARKSPLVDKTRQTTCTFKRGAVYVTEKRLFVWFAGSEHSYLMKQQWLSGDDKRDLARMYSDYLRS